MVFGPLSGDFQGQRDRNMQPNQQTDQVFLPTRAWAWSSVPFLERWIALAQALALRFFGSVFSVRHGAQSSSETGHPTRILMLHGQPPSHAFPCFMTEDKLHRLGGSLEEPSRDCQSRGIRVIDVDVIQGERDLSPPSHRSLLCACWIGCP